MNNENHSPEFERLDPQIEAAVQAIREESLPEDAIRRIEVRAKQLARAANVTSPLSLDSRKQWKSPRFVFAGMALAASLLIFVTLSIVMVDSSRAFAHVIEKVKTIRTVHFATSTQFGAQQERNGRMYLEGDRIRIEQFDGVLVMIGDLDRKKAMFLDMNRKIAQSVDLAANMTREFANPIDQLRQAQSKDAELIGQEILKGRRTHVYRLSKVDLLGVKGNAEMIVWVDVESELPAKIVIRDTDPKAKMEMRFEEFVWNEPLDAQLFSLTIPKNMQPGTFLHDAPHEPVQPQGASDPTRQITNGILNCERAPFQIVWGSKEKSVTLLMRDPESVAPIKQRPNELGQWDLTTGKLKWSEIVAGAKSLASTQDGKTLATVIGFEIQLRNATTGKVSRKTVTDKPLSPLAFSPDGKTLAAGVAEWGPFGGSGGKVSGGIQLWDVEKLNLVRFIADDNPITFVKYSADGKYLVTASNEGSIKVWNAASGELFRVLPGYHRADFAPDGNTIAIVTNSADKNVGKVDLYNLQDGSLVKSFVSEKGTSASTLLDVAFSPNGQSLAASDWNGSVTIWDVATGQRKQTVTHTGGVHIAAFAADSATLATGSEDRTLRLWKIEAE